MKQKKVINYNNTLITKNDKIYTKIVIKKSSRFQKFLTFVNSIALICSLSILTLFFKNNFDSFYILINSNSLNFILY